MYVTKMKGIIFRKCAWEQNPILILEYVATHPHATSEALVAQDIGSGAWVLAIKKSLQLLGS
jgi:hypothetical protein